MRRIGDNEEFLKEIATLASSSINARLQKLPASRQKEIRRLSLRVLKEPELKRSETLRQGAVRLVVALLPETFPLLEKLMGDCTSPYWYEVHFTIFCALERDDFGPADQARILQLVHEYLQTVSSNAGAAAWKAGDLLGDEWRSSETLRILEDLLVSARYVSGRRAALHGIEHALIRSSRAEQKRLFTLVRSAAENDRSAGLRRAAKRTLLGKGCGPPARPAP